MSNVYVVSIKVNIPYIEANFDNLKERLYPSRREAVIRFKNRNAAYVSLTAGLLLQEVAKKVCDVDAKDIEIGIGEQGKPYIIGYEGFCYNISHSGEYVVLAYGEQALGIDIERIRDKDIAVARRCFTETEYSYIAKGYLDDNIHDVIECQSERFFRVWTMKESYLKYTGQGISVPLNSFNVNPINLSLDGIDVGFAIHRLNEYIVAVCSRDVNNVRYIVDDPWT